mgnify:CR=1 FL=1
MLYKNNETVKVDLAHAELVKSLIMCHKPKNILEFGYGGGRVTDKILEAISYNQNSPSYSVVDNWLDVGGIIPDGLLEEYKGRAEIITSNEEDFDYTLLDMVIKKKSCLIIRFYFLRI